MLQENRQFLVKSFRFGGLEFRVSELEDAVSIKDRGVLV
jgi:hypothetical protein